MKVVSFFLQHLSLEDFALRPQVFASGLAFLLVAPLAAQSIEEAQRSQAAGDWPRAENTWRALARAEPQDYRLWTSLGAALAHQNRFNEALEAYGRAKAIAPRDVQTNFNLGLALFKTGRLPEAVAPLRIASEGMPGNGQMQLLLGMSLYGSSSFREAAAALSRARSLRVPPTPEFRQVLAQCYLRTRDTEAARAELSDLLRIDPESASTHMLLGEAEDASGHSDAAKQQFRLAIAANSALPDLHFGLGYLLWKDRDYEGAEREFREEVRLDGKHAGALTYLGDTLLKRGETSEAARLLERAYALDRRLWLTSLDLGILAADRKDFAAAAHHFSAAATLEPKRAEPHYRLAQVYKAQGQAGRAAEELRKVSDLHKEQEDDLVGKISGPKAAP